MINSLKGTKIYRDYQLLKHISYPEFRFTELFCIIDEFCKHFDAENAGNLLEDNSGVKPRRRQASLSDSEIMTILLYFHFGTFRNFKHYYLFFIKGTMKSYFPKAVSYNRFVELESRVFFQLMFFLNLGAFGRCTGITFVDSTMMLLPTPNGMGRRRIHAAFMLYVV